MSDWIVSNPDVLGGKPCVRGTRISVDFILELLASGATPDEILASYPQVTQDGLRAAFAYAASVLRTQIGWDLKARA